MLEYSLVEDSPTECHKSKISYISDGDLICIEHFSKVGKLLSEARMTYEEALDYSRLIAEVCDEAFGAD